MVEIFTDTDYLKLLQDQSGFSALINHPRTQKAFPQQSGYPRSGEESGSGGSQDSTWKPGNRRSLTTTNVFFGRWRTITGAITRGCPSSPREHGACRSLVNLRYALTTAVEVNMTVYPDNWFVSGFRCSALLAAPAPAADATDAAAVPKMDPSLAVRYRLGPSWSGRRFPPALRQRPRSFLPAGPVGAMVLKVLGMEKVPAFRIYRRKARDQERGSLHLHL